MSDLNEQQIAHLSDDVNNGLVIRAFCQHPGFRLYKSALDALLEDKKNAWLKGTDEDARIERIRAQGIQKAVDILKQFIMTGDNSARILKDEVSHVSD